jgi:hypothetical protein
MILECEARHVATILSISKTDNDAERRWKVRITDEFDWLRVFAAAAVKPR